MRILGHNLLPFSVLNQGSGWASNAANGILANVFFFDTNLADQGNFSQHLADMRNLFNNAVAATRIMLRPTQEGFLPLADQQEGWKARSGSVYEIKNGATLHYPLRQLLSGITVHLLCKSIQLMPPATMQVTGRCGESVKLGTVLGTMQVFLTTP